MDFTPEEINEFRLDCTEMLDQSEQVFVRGVENISQEEYNTVFRCFHSLKGGAGMFGFTTIQTFLHHLENEFLKFKDDKKFSSEAINFFLNGIDKSRVLLQNINEDGTEKQIELESLITTINDKTTDTKESQQAPQVNPISTLKSKSNGLIYCIDDEVEILEILKDIFEGSDYSCQTFLKATDMMAAMKKTPPDIVFSDMKMPEVSGMDVLALIKKFNPDIPVVFLSGFLDKATLIESMKLGVYTALEKPFSANVLLATATNAIKYRSLIQNFNKSINLILYQFSDLDDFLKKSGKEEIRKNLRTDLETLFEIRKELRAFQKKEAAE